MKNSRTVILAMLVSVLTLAGCNMLKDNKGNVNIEVEGDTYGLRDTTVYGLCGRGSTMNELQLITDNGDTLTLSLIEARQENQVFGEFSVGDRMAVLLNNDSTAAIQTVNMTSMLGDWITEDMMGGGTMVGISIKDGGICQSINETLVDYKSWRLQNGKLIIVASRENDGEFEQEEVYDLLFVGPDSLAYGEPDATYTYTRQKGEKEEFYDLEVEDDDIDDYIL